MASSSRAWRACNLPLVKPTPVLDQISWRCSHRFLMATIQRRAEALKHQASGACHQHTGGVAPAATSSCITTANEADAEQAAVHALVKPWRHASCAGQAASRSQRPCQASVACSWVWVKKAFLRGGLERPHEPRTTNQTLSGRSILDQPSIVHLAIAASHASAPCPCPYLPEVLVIQRRIRIDSSVRIAPAIGCESRTQSASLLAACLLLATSPILARGKPLAGRGGTAASRSSSSSVIGRCCCACADTAETSACVRV